MFKKRKRRTDIVSPEVVEETRIKFGLSKKEFSELLGISDCHYRICEKKGGFLAFRYYAAIDAIEGNSLRKAFSDLVAIKKIKEKISNIED